MWENFPCHSKLTPGLYLLTCACAHKSVYGFSMMLSGESPSMLFDLVMTRFEDSYNPTIIYDASCLAKEYGLNRELRRFMRIKICSDRFHQCNHTTCCDSFKSSEYGSLLKINTDAAEQTNSVLRRLTTSTTYMSPMQCYIHAPLNCFLLTSTMLPIKLDIKSLPMMLFSSLINSVPVKGSHQKKMVFFGNIS